MSFIPSTNSNSLPPLPPIPAGLQEAVIVGLTDLGTQHVPQYDKRVRQVAITWEFVDIYLNKKGADGAEVKLRRHHTQVFSQSLHEMSNLRAIVQGIENRVLTDAEARAYDLERLLGQPCHCHMQHHSSNGRTFARVATVAPWGKDPRPTPETKPFCWRIGSGEIPEAVPQWIKDKINAADEMHTNGNGGDGAGPQEDLLLKLGCYRPGAVAYLIGKGDLAKGQDILDLTDPKAEELLAKVDELLDILR